LIESSSSDEDGPKTTQHKKSISILTNPNNAKSAEASKAIR